MPQKPLTIVPVTLQPLPISDMQSISPTLSGSCAVKIGQLEVTFQNGVEERLVQIVLRELIN